MMAAIEEIYPIRVSKRYILQLLFKKDVLNERYVYANEMLALYTAFSILENYKDYGIDGNNENVRKSIKIPKPYNGGNYVMNTCIDLYFGKRGKNINILTFSNVFFLLEKLGQEDTGGILDRNI